MKQYVGAKYIGADPIQLQNGTIIKTGDVIAEVPEVEAIMRRSFDPVYIVEEKKIKSKGE